MDKIEEQIKKIEDEIRKTPYHKATERHIGLLRAKLSKLKDAQIEKSSKKSGGGISFAVKKHGDGTVVFVGPPSAGKSTLLNKLTNAKSKVAPYAFTTLTVIPGMMDHKDARIQILDVPGLIEGAEEGKGRGREVLSVVRGANLLILMTDVDREKQMDNIKETLERNGIRINKTPPKVSIKKKISGGISIISNIKQALDKGTIKDIAKEFRLPNAEITIKQKLTLEDLVDTFARNRVYIPTLFVINKVDQLSNKDMENKLNSDKVYRRNISATKGTGLEELKDAIWEALGFVRVYLVRADEEPSDKNPMIMKSGQALSDVAMKIGEEFAEGKTHAKIWGSGAKYRGQEVGLTKKIEEGMQVRFVS